MSLESCEILQYVASAPGSGECFGCAGQPFMSTGEIAAMLGASLGDHVQSGISFQAENGVHEATRQSRVLYSIRATPVTSTDAHSLIEQSRHRFTLAAKIKLMRHWAIGLSNLHANAFAHTNLNLKNLLISTNGEGFIGGLSLATIIPRLDGMTRSFTRDERGTTAFRAPETYYRYRASDIMVTETPESIQTHVFYGIGCQADVWALGIAFLMILTESSIFKIQDARPYLSLRGARRVGLIIRSGASRDKIENAIVTECVRWQSYLMFCRETRKTNIRAMLGSAVARGVIGTREADLFCGLISDMLDPNVQTRSNASTVAGHAVFKVLPGWSPERITSIPTDLRFTPRGGWTSAKDEAVQKALRSAIASPASSHLPAEAVFVCFDIAARAVAGVDAPEPPEIVTAVAAAAVRVGMMLYDTATSIARGGDIYGEGRTTRTLETYVVEYLGGSIKCDEYFARLVMNDVPLLTLAYSLVTSDAPQARAFREKYLEIDTVAFVRFLATVKSRTGSYAKPPRPNTLHDLKLTAARSQV